MGYTLPANYELGAIAEKVAKDLELELQKDDNENLMVVMSGFANVPLNLMQFILGRGEVRESIMLLGELDQTLLHYTGGIIKEGNVCESLYVNNGKKVIGVTFGVPADCKGSLLVCDVVGSISLQELSDVESGQGGGVCIYDGRLPKPGPLKGTAQFRYFSNVYETINTLLK